MSDPFFDHPILNSPYECPPRHWELDQSGQPTQKIIETRRRAEFITPIPKPKKRKGSKGQDEMIFDEGKGLSTKDQRYDPNPTINEVRGYVNTWRNLPPNQWQVTPETQRLLLHWRNHKFNGPRPFFCQIEAAETAIWLTEVAPKSAPGKRILSLLDSVNKEANPDLMRLALKLATGAGSSASKSTAWTLSNPKPARSPATEPTASPAGSSTPTKRGKLLRPPRLLPRRERPLQLPENHPQSRDQPGSLGHPQQRHLTPVRETEERADRREGDQSSRGRGDEGVPSVADMVNLVDMANIGCEPQRWVYRQFGQSNTTTIPPAFSHGVKAGNIP